LDTYRTAGLAVAVVSLLVCGSASAADLTAIWHAEERAGRTVATHHADRAINPASVVKIATSLWALARLGPAHRFETEILTTADGPDDDGVLYGDLIVVGGADPDFHIENAFLVAEALRDSGVRHIEGDLVVNDAFWIGWERGSAGRDPNPGRRALAMGERLRSTLVVAHWDAGTKRAWQSFAGRHGRDVTRMPGVSLSGRVRRDPEVVGGLGLVTHRSRPVVEILRRFNIHSNNDIERFEGALGSPQAMSAWLARRWGEPMGAGLRFETTSGLGVNRMNLKQIVYLLEDLSTELAKHGLGPEAVLPVMNCEPSTLTKLFRSLASDHSADAMTGKTGTLTTTDGGISALAGYLGSGPGALGFVVAVPGCGSRLWEARAAIEDQVSALLATRKRPPLRPACPSPVGTSDVGAQVVVARIGPSSGRGRP
jgi:D-alanyl-D-alanine carboxypeptidase